MAATSPKFVRHARLMSVSLAKLGEELRRELSHGIAGRQSLRFSLRLSCRLITGLWILYRKKAALTRACPPPKRQKRVKVKTDTTDDFGKVTQLLAVPEAGAGDQAAEVPAGLTVDVETITLREEPPAMRPEMLEDEMIPFEARLLASVLSCVVIGVCRASCSFRRLMTGGEFLNELEKLMAPQDKPQAVAPVAAVEEPLPAEELVARPISPILRVESRTPPPRLTSPLGSPLPRLGAPSAEPKAGEGMLAEPLPGAEPSTEAEPAMRTAEDELQGAAPIVPRS
ncbi:hypothetical protein MTO96_029385 [Rhipicephalus appendiculatus]